MDLYAYMQIGTLESIAKANGIEIPRLRGYRLMKDEQPLGQASFAKLFQDCEIDAVEMLCRSIPFWKLRPKYRIYNSKTDDIRNCYLNFEYDENGSRVAKSVRWDRIHGKKRRILKYEVKKNKRQALAQYSLLNKYAGQENVLYIHSRMGGNNWDAYEHKDALLSQPWFLARVDDWWDGTYCDFYAKIDPSLIPAAEDNETISKESTQC